VELPFGSKTVLTSVTGAQVRAALENGLSQIGSVRFPQVSGMVVVADANAPAGARVVSIEVGGKPLRIEADKDSVVDLAVTARQAAEAAGYSVIIADSFSDEYVGAGGLVDMKDAEGRWLNLRPHTSPMQVRYARAHVRAEIDSNTRIRDARDTRKARTSLAHACARRACHARVAFDRTTTRTTTPVTLVTRERASDSHTLTHTRKPCLRLKP
jgi:hypothetical protein